MLLSMGVYCSSIDIGDALRENVWYWLNHLVEIKENI